MIRINKFEAVGVALSIAAMALALFLMRLDGDLTAPASSLLSAADNNEQPAAVIYSENGVAGVGEALESAMEGNNVSKLVVTDVLLGSGTEAKMGDTVEVSYIGTLQNGQEFDNTYKKGATFTFTIGEGKVIKGWEQGVVGMKEGGQRILVIPSDLAYGAEGYGPIPGNATVVYAIELVHVK